MALTYPVTAIGAVSHGRIKRGSVHLPETQISSILLGRHPSSLPSLFPLLLHAARIPAASLNVV